MRAHTRTHPCTPRIHTHCSASPSGTLCGMPLRLCLAILHEDADVAQEWHRGTTWRGAWTEMDQRLPCLQTQARSQRRGEEGGSGTWQLVMPGLGLTHPPGGAGEGSGVGRQSGQRSRGSKDRRPRSLCAPVWDTGRPEVRAFEIATAAPSPRWLKARLGCSIRERRSLVWSWVALGPVHLVCPLTPCPVGCPESLCTLRQRRKRSQERERAETGWCPPLNSHPVHVLPAPGTQPPA